MHKFTIQYLEYKHKAQALSIQHKQVNGILKNGVYNC